MPDAAIHSASWLINPDTPPVANGAILVRNGLIAETGTLPELRKKYSVPVTDHPDCAILPGFVNAHTHLELTHFPSWKLRTHVDYNPRSFTDWLIQMVKICRGLQAGDFRASRTEGLRKCVEAGTTTIGDIIARYHLLPAVAAPPLGGRFYFEVLGHSPARFRAQLDEALTAVDGLDESTARPGLSPHAAYTIAGENLPLVRPAALSRCLPLCIHLAESPEESQFVYDCTGPLAELFYPFVDWERYLHAPLHCSPVEVMNRNGLLTPETLAVHCVHVSLADAHILKERGVTVCLCPRSNDRLDVGRAPVALYKKLGIPLALGTDSLASNDSLSLWDEMRFALDTFAKELSAEDVFRMCTIGGAKALGLADAVGSLEAGKRANFQVVRNITSGAAGLVERIIHQGRVASVVLNGISGSGNNA